MVFKDYFSKQSEVYARYRPHYLEELYALLAHLVVHHSLAWDCATGNGQMALGLAKFFEQVVATDASADQIAKAIPRRKVQLVKDGYRNLDFPFDEMQVAPPKMEMPWNAEQLIGNARSWSASQRFAEIHGEDTFNNKDA